MPNNSLSCNGGAVYIKHLILNIKDFLGAKFFLSVFQEKKKIRKIKNFNGL
jgi:hypothetical protein